MRLVSILSACALAIGVTAAASTPHASASAPPDAHRAAVSAKAKATSVTLTMVTREVAAGAPITVDVKTTQAKGVKVFLQRTIGTKKAFTDIGKVKKNGASTVVGVPMGKYLFRLRAQKHGKTVAVSTPKLLFSYGDLTAAQYCARTEHTGFSGCDSDTISVGSNVFSYTNYGGAYESGPDGDPSVSAQKSSCRSLTLDYAVSNNAADDGVALAGVALAQETADLQSATVPARQVGSATFSISSPAWNLVLWTEGDDNGYAVAWRGTFSCYTSTGDR